MRIGNIKLEFQIPDEKGRWQLLESDGYNFLLQKGEELRKVDPGVLTAHYVKIDE